jgi:hypothetical protein
VTGYDVVDVLGCAPHSRQRSYKTNTRSWSSACYQPRVPRLGTLYPTMEPKIRRLPARRRLTEADIIKPAFRLERGGRLEIYYAPLDWLRPTARVAIVGLTPSKGTMLIAYQAAVDGLAAGRSAARVLDDVKAAAPFSGFRPQLVRWLEQLRIHHHLGLKSALELWDGKGRRLFHPTSAVRYPVLKNGDNYSGARLAQNPLLVPYIDDLLAPELARIPKALVVPLGVRVDEALKRLIDADKLDPTRCLVGFPHPSGRNPYAADQWATNKKKLKRKVAAWFRDHPADP